VADYWVSVSGNLVAALIWVLLVAAAVGLWYTTRRRKLLKFFGLQNHRRVVIYASRLDVVSGGSLRLDRSGGSFQAIATPEYEVNLIAAIKVFFDRSARFLKWQGTPLLSWADINVEAVVSPPAPDQIEPRDTFIAIGSPGYNSASQAIEADFAAIVRFVNDNAALALSGGEPLRDPALGAVQRLANTTTGQVAFYVGGPSAEGTTAATNYLLREWKHLAKRYSSCPFYVIVSATAGGARYDLVAATP
jgi:hypothetical protein